MNCSCSRVLDHNLNHGLFLSLFKFCWLNSKLNLRKLGSNSGLQYCLRFQVLLDLYLSEASPFLSAQLAVLSSFFQVFVVLGMYNFDKPTNPSVQHSNVLPAF